MIEGSRPPRLVVLASGNGSNFEALATALDAAASRGEACAELVGLVTDRPEAPCVARALRLGIASVALPARGLARAVYDSLLAARVASLHPDWVLLLGWMRVLSMAFLASFPGRVINLHPALPGAFPGTGAIARAFESARAGGSPKTGAMLHLVPDEGVDSGPVLAVEEVAIDPAWDLGLLERAVHEAEHRLVAGLALRLSLSSVS